MRICINNKSGLITLDIYHHQLQFSTFSRLHSHRLFLLNQLKVLKSW